MRRSGAERFFSSQRILGQKGVEGVPRKVLLQGLQQLSYSEDAIAEILKTKSVTVLQAVTFCFFNFDKQGWINFWFYECYDGIKQQTRVFGVKIKDFQRELSQRKGIQLGDYYIFHNLELYDTKSGESVYFDDIRKLLLYKIDGISVRSLIHELRAGNLDCEIDD